MRGSWQIWRAFARRCIWRCKWCCSTVRGSRFILIMPPLSDVCPIDATSDEPNQGLINPELGSDHCLAQSLLCQKAPDRSDIIIGQLRAAISLPLWRSIFAMVQSPMFARRQDHQVGGPVIIANPINMMDVLVFCEQAANLFFGYYMRAQHIAIAIGARMSRHQYPNISRCVRSLVRLSVRAFVEFRVMVVNEAARLTLNQPEPGVCFCNKWGELAAAAVTKHGQLYHALDY